MLRLLRSLRRSLTSPDYRGALLRSLPRNAICAEVGVWKGHFSERILSETHPKELHLIDPWKFDGEFPNRWYGGSIAKAQSDMDSIYDHVVRTLEGRATIHRGRSADVLCSMPDDYFDWIYIDGDHGYEAVLTDLELARQKVRPGGFVTGDDLYWGKAEDLPVKRALDFFLEAHNLAEATTLFGNQFSVRMN